MTYSGRPRAASTPEERLITSLKTHLSDRHIDADRVARLTILLPTTVQAELGKIVWHLVGKWAGMHGTYPAGHPMHNNHATAARVIEALRH